MAYFGRHTWYEKGKELLAESLRAVGAWNMILLMIQDHLSLIIPPFFWLDVFPDTNGGETEAFRFILPKLVYLGSFWYFAILKVNTFFCLQMHCKLGFTLCKHFSCLSKSKQISKQQLIWRIFKFQWDSKTYLWRVPFQYYSTALPEK